jgi:hypothetical protein
MPFGGNRSLQVFALTKNLGTICICAGLSIVDFKCVEYGRCLGEVKGG